MTTDFGKELRKIRVEHDERLLDMSKKLGKSAAFISAVELGKRSPPDGFENSISEIYRLKESAQQRLFKTADSVRKKFTLTPKSETARDMVGMMARRLDNLSDEQVEAISRLIKSGDTHGK